jgi:hypothetical protein
MSRTYRSPIYRSERNSSCYRQPKYASTFRAAGDEYGMRYGAIPTKVRTGKWVSSSKSDWKTKQCFHQVCRPTTVEGLS